MCLSGASGTTVTASATSTYIIRGAFSYFGNGCAPDVYWGNTSSNSVLGGLVSGADDKMLKRLYACGADGAVRAPWIPASCFSDLAVAPQAVWSMLYLAGYLTTDDTALPGDVDRLRPLRMPNREVAKLSASEITGPLRPGCRRPRRARRPTQSARVRAMSLLSPRNWKACF